jgi:Zn-dependent membrane protease YugP
VDGHLTDHYDPTKRALFLSTDIFHGRTIAAVGVAAHESGHALQHQEAGRDVQPAHGAGADHAVFQHGVLGVILLLGFFWA